MSILKHSYCHLILVLMGIERARSKNGRNVNSQSVAAELNRTLPMWVHSKGRILGHIPGPRSGSRGSEIPLNNLKTAILSPSCLLNSFAGSSEWTSILTYYLESWAKSFRAAYEALQPSGHGFSFPAVGFLVITISGILFASTRCECALFKRRLVEFESFFRDYVRSFTSKLVEYRFSLPRITRTRQDYPKNTLQVSKNAILLFVVILVGSDKSYLYISLGTLNSKG